MSISNLPKDWRSIKFRDLIKESFTGLVRSAKEQSSENSYDYLKMNNLNLDGSFDLTKVVKVEATDTEVSRYSLLRGDFLFNTRNSVELVGKCGVFDDLADRPMLFNNNLLKVKFIEIYPEIVAHWLNSPIGKQNLRGITSATTSVAAIYQKQLLSLDIPLPPLAEQKVIADKLDSLLAQVETTKARLDRVPDILKRFRQSVLAAAISGRLTEEWREESTFSTIKKTISEVAVDVQIGLVRSAAEQNSIPSEDRNTPYLKMNHIDNNWGVTLKKIVYVSCTTSEVEKYELREGDWLFNTRNSRELVGKSCVWCSLSNFVYNNNILRIRLAHDYSSWYLEIWLRSPEGKNNLESIKSATTNVSAIYQKQLLKQEIPFPPYAEQTEIVRRVEELFDYADKIEQQTQAATERVNKLTQSILAKAFCGELTKDWRAANSDLISGDNSAEALLKKIKSEREAVKSKKPNKRARKDKN